MDLAKGRGLVRYVFGDHRPEASVEAAPLDIAESGTGTSTQTTNGVPYSDGMKIMTGTALVEAAFASDDRAD